jgi:hypothetical protein
MSTLDSLKLALRQKATESTSASPRPLSDSAYSAAFDMVMQGPEQETYQNFIVPELASLLTSLLDSRIHVSILEVGPGPKSVLGCLPE